MLGIDRRWKTLLLVGANLVLATGLGCRRELPELFDRNQAPETYVTAAPVESLFDGFQVHLSWYGRDPDGQVAYFLWAWTDSSRAYFAAWNPETTAEDRILREGLFDATHLTTQTDSVFTMQANDNGGTSRDVTFNITAVDDQGKRDPVPARLYFYSSVDARPEIIWLQSPPDTLDAGESFSCRFTATTENGYILGYRWASGDDPQFEPRTVLGEPLWTYQVVSPPDVPESQANVDARYYGLQDSMAVTLEFDNDILAQVEATDSPAELKAAVDEIKARYKFGTYLIKAKAIDLAGVESLLDTNLDHLRGVVAPVLNRDPDTRLRPWDGADDYPLFVRFKASPQDSFTTYGVNAVRVDTFPDGSPAPAGFHYAVQDTLPWGDNTWVRFYWQGWDVDDPLIASDPGDPQGEYQKPNRTRFQMGYTWKTNNLSNAYPLSADSDGRYPGGGAEGYPQVLEFDRYGEAGADFEMNIMPVNYIVYGYSQDYFDRVDGTPATVTFNGGFSSHVDSIVLGYVNSTTTVNLTTLPPGDPVRINLHGQFVLQPGERVNWDSVARTYTVLPNSVGGAPDFNNEFNLTLTFHGHDDARNGEAAQLGRAWWDLVDTDFSNSSFQFVTDKFEPANETTVKFWRAVFPGNADPPASGGFTVQLRIKEGVFTLSNGPAATPLYLGPKTFTGKFCNTISSQVLTEYIEDEAQRQLGLNNIGRVGQPRSAPLDIQYMAP